MKFNELDEKYKKIYLRLVKECDCFRLIKILNIEYNDDNSILDGINNSFSWDIQKEGYEYWYHIAIKFSILCISYYSNIIDKNISLEYLKNLLRFSNKYGSRIWYREALKIIDNYD